MRTHIFAACGVLAIAGLTVSAQTPQTPQTQPTTPPASMATVRPSRTTSRP